MFKDHFLLHVFIFCLEFDDIVCRYAEIKPWRVYRTRTSIVYWALCHFSSLGTKYAFTITYGNVRPIRSIARFNGEGVSEILHCNKSVITEWMKLNVCRMTFVHIRSSDEGLHVIWEESLVKTFTNSCCTREDVSLILLFNLFQSVHLSVCMFETLKTGIWLANASMWPRYRGPNDHVSG